MSANLCTEPRQPGDTRYVYGVSCTWHGPIADAGERAEAQPCCPVCGGDLLEKPSVEAWTVGVYCNNMVAPGTWSLIFWGRGQCFPDNETLSGAYRQAMEGQS